jgi:hypothetical protein
VSPYCCQRRDTTITAGGPVATVRPDDGNQCADWNLKKTPMDLLTIVEGSCPAPHCLSFANDPEAMRSRLARGIGE